MIEPDVLRRLEAAIAQTATDLIGQRVTVHKGHPPTTWPVGHGTVRVAAIADGRLQLVVEVISGNFDAYGPEPVPGDLYLLTVPRHESDDPLRVTVDRPEG